VEERVTYTMDEGQEPEVIADVYQHISHLTSPKEKVYYIAHQKKRMMKSRPDSVVLTNERIIIIRQGLGGSRTEDHQWKDIVSVQMRDGIMGTTFSLLDRNDNIVQMDDLPKAQLEKVCQLAHELRHNEA
jgi:hypothetical protein